MSNFFNLIQFSDLHIGNKFITKRDIDELMNNIVKSITDDNTAILFTGDLLHHRVALDSEPASLAVDLLNRLDTLDVPTVILQGTKSHDMNYMEVINSRIFKNIVFIDSLSEITIVPKNHSDRPLSVLCVPEEYMDDMNDYYKDTVFSDKFYDVVMFHGTITDVAKFNSMIESQPFKKAPLFKKSDFWKVTNIVIAGHIHEEQEYYSGDKYLNYCGSWGRMNHGSESDKMMKVIHTQLKDDNSLVVEKVDNIINTVTNEFKTYIVSLISEAGDILTISNQFDKKLVKKLSFSELLPSIDQLIGEEEPNRFSRFIFKGNFKNVTIKSIKKTFFNRTDVKIVFLNEDKLQEKEKKDVLTAIDELKTRSIPDQIVYFLQANQYQVDKNQVVAYMSTLNNFKK